VGHQRDILQVEVGQQIVEVVGERVEVVAVVDRGGAAVPRRSWAMPRYPASATALS
jgi:hypothetical protein